MMQHVGYPEQYHTQAPLPELAIIPSKHDEASDTLIELVNVIGSFPDVFVFKATIDHEKCTAYVHIGLDDTAIDMVNDLPSDMSQHFQQTFDSSVSVELLCLDFDSEIVTSGILKLPDRINYEVEKAMGEKSTRPKTASLLILTAKSLRELKDLTRKLDD